MIGKAKVSSVTRAVTFRSAASAAGFLPGYARGRGALCQGPRSALGGEDAVAEVYSAWWTPMRVTPRRSTPARR
jgi:hypothetical protein